MSKDLSVSEVPAAREEVSHDVGRSRNVVMERDIAVVTLVQGLQS